MPRDTKSTPAHKRKDIQGAIKQLIDETDATETKIKNRFNLKNFLKKAFGIFLMSLGAAAILGVIASTIYLSIIGGILGFLVGAVLGGIFIGYAFGLNVIAGGHLMYSAKSEMMISEVLGTIKSEFGSVKKIITELLSEPDAVAPTSAQIIRAHLATADGVIARLDEATHEVPVDYAAYEMERLIKQPLQEIQAELAQQVVAPEPERVVRTLQPVYVSRP